METGINETQFRTKTMEIKYTHYKQGNNCYCYRKLAANLITQMYSTPLVRKDR